MNFGNQNTDKIASHLKFSIICPMSSNKFFNVKKIKRIERQ